MQKYDALRFGHRAGLKLQPVSMELRNRVRYRLSADAVFAWEGVQHVRLLGEGVTRDISLAGAFIFTRTCPPVGASLELDIFLYPPPGSEGRTVRIKTEARVSRVEHSAAAEGFAAVSQDFTLLFDSNTKNAFRVSSDDKNNGGIVQGLAADGIGSNSAVEKGLGPPGRHTGHSRRKSERERSNMRINSG
jgi:hypothetical protein